MRSRFFVILTAFSLLLSGSSLFLTGVRAAHADVDDLFENAMDLYGAGLEAVAEAMWQYADHDLSIYDDPPSLSAADEAALEQAKREARDKALFIADMEAELRAAGVPGDPFNVPWERPSYRAAEQLWRIQAAPDVAAGLKAALLDAETLLEERLAALEERVGSIVDIADETRNAVSEVRRSDTLDPYIVFAAANHDLLHTVVYGYGYAGDILALLWHLRDDADAMAFVGQWAAGEDFDPADLMALVKALPDASADMRPGDTVRVMLEERRHAARLRAIYEAADLWEYSQESIGLPLSTLLPEAAESLARQETVPLAEAGAALPGPEVTLRDLDERETEALFAAIEACVASAGRYGDEEFPASDFLRPGETIYTFADKYTWEKGAVFSGPLAVLAEDGPFIIPLTPETVDMFVGMFLQADRTAPLFAAVGSPEEMAAHLNSLAVMLGERERSLYGPFEEYMWRPDAEFLQGGRYALTPEDYPADIPGMAPRFVDIDEPALLVALALRADAEGLARLMGPIRAVWTPSATATDENGRDVISAWTELRYTPSVTKDVPGAASLETSPLLELNRGDLEALRIRHASEVAVSLDNFAEYGLCGEDGLERGSQACRDAVASAKALGAASLFVLDTLGFKAPNERYLLSYAAIQFRDDPEQTRRLQAIIMDTDRSYAARYHAVLAMLKRGQWNEELNDE